MVRGWVRLGVWVQRRVRRRVTLGLDRIGALAGARVPYAHSLVARGGPKHFGLLRVPPQLIHGVLVALELRARGAARRVDGPNAHLPAGEVAGTVVERRGSEDTWVGWNDASEPRWPGESG